MMKMRCYQVKEHSQLLVEYDSNSYTKSMPSALDSCSSSAFLLFYVSYLTTWFKSSLEIFSDP